MAPAKPSRDRHDDTKSETPHPKEKNGNLSNHNHNHHSNGKMRRVASSTGSNLREVTNANNTAGPSPTAAEIPDTAVQEEPVIPGLQWPAFERDVLHAYRRAYRLNTPTAFASDYRQWVLTQPGSVGLYSPTIARRAELRRQTTDQLTGAVRKHFNGLGVQENDILVEFLHKVRNPGVGGSGSGSSSGSGVSSVASISSRSSRVTKRRRSEF